MLEAVNGWTELVDCTHVQRESVDLPPHFFAETMRDSCCFLARTCGSSCLSAMFVGGLR